MQRRPATADRGWSLIETVVSMALMSVAGAIFTTGFVQIYNTFRATERQAAGQQELTTAFLRLDREVQYATALSMPAQVGADWYAEYLIGVGATHTCVELRLNAAAGQLQRRTWTDGTAISPTAWLPLASGITPVATVAPFTLLPADAKVDYHRLQVTVVSTAGQQLQTIWPALNAGVDRFDSVCTGARGMP